MRTTHGSVGSVFSVLNTLWRLIVCTCTATGYTEHTDVSHSAVARRYDTPISDVLVHVPLYRTVLPQCQPEGRGSACLTGSGWKRSGPRRRPLLTNIRADSSCACRLGAGEIWSPGFRWTPPCTQCAFFEWLEGEGAANRRDRELKTGWTDRLACGMEPVVNTVDEGGQKIPLQCYVRT